jgi:hypothetical protein
VKAFSALRVRLRQAWSQTGRYQASEKHVVVCGDSDAIVMALMLDPRADVTIDFGSRNGLLQIEQLRQRWLLQPLRHADIHLGIQDHPVIGSYTQVCLLHVLPLPGRSHSPNAFSFSLFWPVLLVPCHVVQ